MQDTYKFPNGGYDVVIIKKEDVVKTIYDNITDQEIALELVHKLELDCSNFLREGKWASIPFMGNIRVPKAKQMLKSREQQELLQEASETLDKTSYVMFRKQLNSYNARKIRFEKSFNYLLSIMINRYTKYYKRLMEVKGERFAKITLYTCFNWSVCNTDYIE